MPQPIDCQGVNHGTDAATRGCEPVSTTPVFDAQKWEWMNGEYFRALSKAERLDRLAPVLVAAGLIDAGRAAAKGREWRMWRRHRANG